MKNLWFTIFLLISCSSDVEVASKSEIFDAILIGDPNAKEIKEISHIVNCTLYTEPCQNVSRATVMGYEIFLVEFENEEQARREARKKMTLYRKNWIFDNIQNEKPLLDFFRKHLEAKD